MKTVTIQGQIFDWDETNGLDPSAILTVQNWIKKLARRYFARAANLNMEMNDLIQAGNMGALKAARTYRPEYGAGFLTWANFKISDEMRRLCRHLPTLSLEAAAESAEYLGRSAEHIADPTDQTKGTENKLLLGQLMRRLNKHERALLTQYYGLGSKRKPQSLRLLGKKYGVSAQCVSNRVNRALHKLRV
ncbi:MAG: sigma-70 family RNA polymerase sigma factor [Holophagales bacterium]|jgi:RNA polymerase sigma factor (sigma-70 family)|nr:sigma-70 family RNA polymerase sigma factor [Holophagales bacterium]